jgi:hypothetical protein
LHRLPDIVEFLHPEAMIAKPHCQQRQRGRMILDHEDAPWPSGAGINGVMPCVMV